MKNTLCWLLMLIPCFSYGASDQCTTAKVLTKIRPGAPWVMQGDSFNTLKWLGTKQSKPSSAEVEKAKKVCVEDAKKRDSLKAQARLDVKDPTVPTDKKLRQLIMLLDLDK